jgi:hypothetical protein
VRGTSRGMSRGMGSAVAIEVFECNGTLTVVLDSAVLVLLSIWQASLHSVQGRLIAAR